MKSFLRRLALLNALVQILLPFAVPQTLVLAQQQPSNTPPPQSPTQTTAPKRAPDADISWLLNVTVTDDKGRHTTKLPPNAFTVYADKRPLAITHFGELDTPLSVGFVLDVSGSMADPYKRVVGAMSLAEYVVARFMEQSHAANDYFVIAFNDAPTLLQDRTKDRNAVLAAVGKLSPLKTRGRTALYDACYLAVDKAARASRAKRALVVISDGQDNISRYSLGELKRLLQEQDVLLYAVGFYQIYEESPLFKEGQAILEELAKITGGRAFVAVGRQLAAVMDYIATELRHQYSVVVTLPPLETKRKWHDLEIKVMPVPDGAGKQIKPRARTRKGFYTPAGSP